MNVLKVLYVVFCLAIVLTGCKKDDSDSDSNELNEGNFEKWYFSVPYSTFELAEFPSSTGSNVEILNITGNDFVIPGGLLPVTIEVTSVNIQYFLFGINNVDAYLKLEMIEEYFIENEVTVYLIIGESYALDNADIKFAVIDGDGKISNTYTIEVDLIEVATGNLQVICTWDQLNDVDLHLIEPEGEEIYWDNPESDFGGVLDMDSNPACDLDGINNENITYDEEATIQVGEYTVRVDLHESCFVTDTTYFTVKVLVNDTLITELTSGTNPYYGQFEYTDADNGGEGSGVTVMTFEITPEMMEEEGIAVREVYNINYNNEEDKKYLLFKKKI
ncbi:MAG: hypothetical protein JW894_09330 [Bacteroidales bacterium]|nr:hypothetical protein [Bacteroidales bacterium]